MSGSVVDKEKEEEVDTTVFPCMHGHPRGDLRGHGSVK